LDNFLDIANLVNFGRDLCYRGQFRPIPLSPGLDIAYLLKKDSLCLLHESSGAAELE